MYIVLADDLTGAMDTGIQFRKYGIQTSVIVSADDCELRGDSCAGAVSINNSSRELSGSEAYEKTLRAVHRLSLSPQDILYKKIDSMMRGNPVQEIDAALEASGCRKAIVTPSFPQEGRIVREESCICRTAHLRIYYSGGTGNPAFRFGRSQRKCFRTRRR